MEDVTARIIVTAQSSAAVQGLQNTKKALDDVTNARLKELQVQKAQAQLELAEFESARAAEKAYAAEIPLRGAERQLEFMKENHQQHIELYKTKKALGELDDKGNKKWRRALKKEAGEIALLTDKVQDLTKEYLPLANAEAGANLAAFNAKQKLDGLNQSTDVAIDRTEKFSWKIAGARAASRAFGMDLGAESANMIKYGIIAAGAASAIKLLQMGLEALDKEMIEEAELWKRNNENMKEAAAAWAEQREKQNSALSTLENYHKQSVISAEQSLEMSKAIKTLGGDFTAMGVEIDQATGKIKNFDKANAAYRRNMIEREKAEIQAQLKNLQNERMRQVKIRDTAGVPIWFGGNVRIGGEEKMLAAGKEIDRIANESIKLQRRLAELRRMTPEQDSEQLNKAQAVDAQKAMDDRTKNLKTQIRIQELRNKGLEREAHILEINARLDKERLGLANDQQRAAFDKNRGEIVALELKKFDASQKKKELAPKKTKSETIKRQTAIGSFSAAELNQQIRTGTPAQKTADNTKKMVSTTQHIANQLDTIATKALQPIAYA